MRRLLVVALMVMAAVLPATTPVLAANPPTIVKFPKGDIDLGNLNDGTTGDVCAFPVHAVIHLPGGGRAIFFDGQPVGFAALSVGAITVTLTNIDTGKAITVNISGPGGLSGDGVPVVGRGPWLIFEPIDQGGLRFFHGVIEFAPVSYGVHATLISGTEENLCNRIA